MLQSLFMFFFKDFVVIKDKNSKTCVYIVLDFFYIFSYIFDLCLKIEFLDSVIDIQIVLM